MKWVAALILMVLLAAGLWLTFDEETTNSSANSASQPYKFDTTGGQEMKPRWGK